MRLAAPILSLPISTFRGLTLVLETSTDGSIVTTETSTHCPPGRPGLLHIYPQTPACPYPKISLNLSHFLTNSSLVHSCPFFRERRTPFPISLPSEYAAVAVSLPESLRHVTTAPPEPLLFSAFCEMLAVGSVTGCKCVPGEVPRWLVCKPQAWRESSGASNSFRGPSDAHTFQGPSVTWLPLPCVFLNSLHLQSAQIALSTNRKPMT